MTNTRPVPSVNAPMVDKDGYVQAPWIQFFQQDVQKAAAVVDVTVGASPFSYTPNQNGTIIITGGTLSNAAITRGSTTINLGSAKPFIIPVSIGDTVSVAYSVKPTMQFLGA